MRNSGNEEKSRREQNRRAEVRGAGVEEGDYFNAKVVWWSIFIGLLVVLAGLIRAAL